MLGTSNQHHLLGFYFKGDTHNLTPDYLVGADLSHDCEGKIEH